MKLVYVISKTCKSIETLSLYKNDCIRLINSIYEIKV